MNGNGRKRPCERETVVIFTILQKVGIVLSLVEDRDSIDFESYLVHNLPRWQIWLEARSISTPISISLHLELSSYVKKNIYFFPW